MPVPSLALGVHGRLAPGATGAPAEDYDCYSTFLALGTTLGWNSAMDGTSPGSWGMSHAGGPWFSDDATFLCGWFHHRPHTATDRRSRSARRVTAGRRCRWRR